MLFTEKDLLNAFKANVDNKGWIYFVGNPESNAKFIIDYLKEHKEEINEEELDELADSETYKKSEEFDNYLDDIFSLLNGKNKLKLIIKECLIWAFKVGYRKAKFELCG